MKVMIVFGLLFCLSLPLPSGAQHSLPKAAAKVDTTIYQFADIQPDFPGGAPALNTYLRDNASASGKTGRVIVSFVVKSDGSLTSVRVERTTSEALNPYAVSLIEHMPKWKPGLIDYKPVNVLVMLPVQF